MDKQFSWVKGEARKLIAVERRNIKTLQFSITNGTVKNKNKVAHI